MSRKGKKSSERNFRHHPEDRDVLSESAELTKSEGKKEVPYAGTERDLLLVCRDKDEGKCLGGEDRDGGLDNEI